jgi:transcriptional regulator GlxA family with amidase domain
MSRKTIAFLVFPEITPLDIIGPLQVLKVLENLGPHEMVTVGERIEPMATDIGLQIQPERTFAEVAKPFGLIVPGGTVGPLKAITNDGLMAYVRSAAQTAEVVGSVCTGALILAAAGLLEGRRATTHWAFMDVLGRLGASPVRERWVTDGKFITAAGVSAGIDMAISLVAQLTGESEARTIQATIEYDPKPPLGGIDWGWVEQVDLGRTLMAPMVPMLRSALASKPDVAAKFFP